jgi:tRNA (guanosine-2'-O-)-methyltransferase
LSCRQPDLRVVLEGVAISHNASAVIRTCDAAGVLNLDLIAPAAEAFFVNKAISTRADKWLQFHLYQSSEDCLRQLKQKGHRIAATCLAENSRPFTEIDYTQPIAIVFGNESDGISKEARAAADDLIRIPMVGMVQSLNLSVSVGIILYEALRQRWTKGFYRNRRLSDADFEALSKKWLGLD